MATVITLIQVWQVKVWLK